MTTYYVSNAGSDTNSGTSTGASWATIAKVNAQSFSPGDSILFNKGDTWRVPSDATLTPPSSGTSGSTITFGAYGTGNNPVILGSSDYDDTSKWTDLGSNLWATANGSFSGTPRIWWYDTNGSVQPAFEVTGTPDANWEWQDDTVNDRIIVYSDGGNPASVADGIEIPPAVTYQYGILCSKNYIVIDGIDVKYVNYIGIRFQSGCTSSTVQNNTVVGMGETGIHFYLSTGPVNVDTVTVSHVRRHGVSAEKVHTGGGTLEDCTIHDTALNGTTWGSCIACSSYTVTIQNNTLYDADYGKGGSGINMDGAQSCTVQNNTIYNFKQAGVDLTGAADADNRVCQNNIIRYNKIYSGAAVNWTYAIQCWTADVADDRRAYNNEIYYNLIYDCQEGMGLLGHSDDNKVYNNVFYNSGGRGLNLAQYTNVKAEDNIIKNNIFHTAGSRLIQAGTNSFSTYSNISDYNCFYASSFIGKFQYGSTYDSLSAWQSATSQDANSIAIDPLLVNPTTDFSLQSGSPCRDAGVDVSLTLDYVGNTVPVGSAVDIGAYEWQTGAVTISPSVLSLVCSIPSPIEIQTSGGGDSWLTGWNYRKKITVQSANISNDLTDFPVYVDITADSDIGGHVEDTTNGYDIRFTDTDGETLLKYERCYFAVDTGVAAGHFWVKVPTLYASPTGTQNEIYIYYDDDDGTVDGQDADNTWRSEYKGVWHMHDASGDATDSSGNNNTLTETSGTIASDTGKIYLCRDFEADDTEYFTIADNASLSITGDLSFSAWINMESITTGAFVNKYGAATHRSYASRCEDTGKVCIYWSHDGSALTDWTSDNDEMTAILGTWFHYAATIDVSAYTGAIYINGSAVDITRTTGTGTAIFDSDAAFGIGADANTPGSYFDGKMEEVRIYSGLYPAGWIAFEHANANEDDNELTWATEEGSTTNVTVNPSVLAVTTSLPIPTITAVDNTAHVNESPVALSITVSIQTPSVSLVVNPTQGMGMTMGMEL